MHNDNLIKDALIKRWENPYGSGVALEWVDPEKLCDYENTELSFCEFVDRIKMMIEAVNIS